MTHHDDELQELADQKKWDALTVKAVYSFRLRYADEMKDEGAIADWLDRARQAGTAIWAHLDSHPKHAQAFHLLSPDRGHVAFFVGDKPGVMGVIRKLPPREDLPRVAAEVHTDDRCIEVKFDAAKWFETATAEDIMRLAEDGWGGHLGADAVAQDLDGRCPEVTKFWVAKRAVDVCRGHTQGFECHVDETQAMKWLRKRRPEIITLLEDNNIILS
jgi:hypothetical protein